MTAAARPGNPYIGPRSFQTGERLYGRDRELRELVNLLVAERIVLLYSPSGAGKTSLIQAALIPTLSARGFNIRPIVRVNRALTADGTNRYLVSTLLALEEEVAQEQQLSSTELTTLSIAAYLERRFPDEQADGDLFIFDQFEEILTLDPVDETARRDFFRQIGDMLSDRRRWALFAMREDHVPALDPYLRLLPTRLATTFRLALLSVDAAREALEAPAQAAGIPFVRDTAVQLVNDLARVRVQRTDGGLEEQRGPSVEPVQLQVVCYRIWERLPLGASTIGRAEVAALGDVDRALGDYYDDRVALAVASSEVSERTIRSWFDRALITPQGLRGQILQGANPSDDLPADAVQQLVDSYLVRRERRRGATWIELAHDRLIAPVRASNAAWFDANLSTLQRQAELWEKQGRPAGLLLRDNALTEAETWVTHNPEQMNDTERAFLALCQEARAVAEREQQQARRIRTLAIGASIVSVVALIAFIVAVLFFQQSERSARQARARELAAAAVSNLQVDPLLSLILARAGVETTRSVGEPVVDEAYQALQQAVTTSRVRRIIKTGERGVQDLAASPDGALLATTSNDGVVRLFDAASGAELRSIETNTEAFPAFGLAFSPDGTLLAAGVGDQAVIWRVDSGVQQLVLDAYPEADLDIAEHGVLNVAFSPDGNLLATAGSDSSVRLWESTGGTEQLTLDNGGEAVTVVAFSPDGATLASGDSVGVIALWDTATGEQLDVLDEHLDSITDLDYSFDGSLLASASVDLTIRLWDVETGEQLDVLRGHTLPVESVRFSPDGETLATASQDSTARLWSVADGRLILTLSGHKDALSGALFSRDGATLTTASLDGTLRSWDLSLAPSDGAYGAVFSPDGATLATRGAGGVRLWDTATGKALQFVASEDEISALAYSVDGAQLAAGSADSNILLIDPTEGTVLATLEGHTDQVNSLAFSPDDRTLASASDDRTIRLWDVASGSLVNTFDEQAAEVTVVAFSPDGSLIASGNYIGEIKLWNPVTGEERFGFTLVENGVVRGLDFSPDGLTLAAGDDVGNLAVWDIAIQREVQRINVDSPINDVVYSPDGHALAIAEGERQVNILQAADLAVSQMLPHPSEVYTVSYSQDGRHVVTAAGDGIARMFPLLLDDALAISGERAVRGLSVAECVLYSLTSHCANSPR